MRCWTVSMIAGLLSLAGCSGALHQVQKPSQQEISAAEADVLAEPNLEVRRQMTVAEANETLTNVIKRIHPVAQQVCREVGHGSCYWRYAMSRSRELNAGATDDGRIVLNRGLAELTASDDEIGMVLAHEVAHLVANHPANTQRNAALGRVVGGLIGAVADTGAARGRVYTGGYYTRVGGALGEAFGGLSYSKEQEREADYLGVLIAYRAGFDLDKARAVMVTLARDAGKREAGTFDSHPMGAERLAGYDRAVAEVRASNGRLPPRLK